MHRQLYSADDFTERTVAALLRDATSAKDAKGRIA